jgi:hypothetical protein
MWPLLGIDPTPESSSHLSTLIWLLVFSTVRLGMQNSMCVVIMELLAGIPEVMGKENKIGAGGVFINGRHVALGAFADISEDGAPDQDLS